MVITPTPKPKSNVVAFPVPVKNQTVWNYYRVSGSWRAVYTPTGELLGEGTVDTVVKVDTRTADEYLVEEFMAAMRDQANLHLLCVRQGFIYKDNMDLVDFTVGEDTQAVRQSADMVRIHKKKSEGLQKFESTHQTIFCNTSGYTFPWRDEPFWVANISNVTEYEFPVGGRVEPVCFGKVSLDGYTFRHQGSRVWVGQKQRSLSRMISNAISPTGRWLGSYDVPELFKGQIRCLNNLRSVLKQVKMAAIQVSAISDKSKIDRIELQLRDTFKFLPQERARSSVILFHRKDKGSLFECTFFNERVKVTNYMTTKDLVSQDHPFCPHVINGLGLTDDQVIEYKSAIMNFRSMLEEIMNDAMGLL